MFHLFLAMLGRELGGLLGGKLLYYCFLSSILFFCINFRSLSTWVGSAVKPVCIEGPPRKEFDVFPEDSVDIFVRRGFLTRVYFSLRIPEMLELLS